MRPTPPPPGVPRSPVTLRRQKAPELAFETALRHPASRAGRGESGAPVARRRGAATSRNLGTRPCAASTSRACRSGASNCTLDAPDGTSAGAPSDRTGPVEPSSTPMTQSPHAMSRTAQRSQSMIISAPRYGRRLPASGTLGAPTDNSGRDQGRWGGCHAIVGGGRCDLGPGPPAPAGGPVVPRVGVDRIASRGGWWSELWWIGFAACTSRPAQRQVRRGVGGVALSLINAAGVAPPASAAPRVPPANPTSPANPTRSTAPTRWLARCGVSPGPCGRSGWRRVPSRRRACGSS